MPLTIASDRTIGQSKQPPFAPLDLSNNASKKELSRLLRITDAPGTVQEIPSDLEGAFYKNWQCFCHMRETPSASYRSFLLRLLKELALSNPSEVMSRYSMSATKAGSTHVALGFLIGLVSLAFGLTTVSSCFRS